MSLDAQETHLTRYGRVEIEGGKVVVYGFRGKNTSCRDVAVLACAHAIGVLQREMMRCIQSPVGGDIAIGD